MMTAVDTNVLVILWDEEESISLLARGALDAATQRGGLVISGAVYGELVAHPNRSEKFINAFLIDARVKVDWATGEEVWKTAGTAYKKYTDRRRKHRSGSPRRILTDFVIGAHAFVKGHDLLTLDERIYKAAFPKLRVYGL